MTAFYIQVEDPEIIRELSHGRCPEVIQDMARTMTDWGFIEQMQKSQTRPVRVARKPRKPKPRKKKAA